MANAHFTSTLAIKVDGQPLPDDLTVLLAGSYVDDNLHLPDMFALRFRDPDRLVLTKANVKIGSKLELSVNSAQDGTPAPLMNGEVTALEAELDGTGTFTTIRGYDPSHRLHRGTRSETYQQMTYADVVRKVAQRAGLQVGKVDATSTVHPLLAQGNQSDWDFLREIADVVGYHLAVENGKLDFAKPTKASTAPDGTEQDPTAIDLGSDLLQLRAAITAGSQVPNVEVRGWDPAAQQAVVATALSQTQSAVVGVTPQQLASTFGAVPYVVSHQPHRTQATADAVAKAIADRVAGTFAEFEGVARGNPKLRAGLAISIGNLGAPFDGKYTLSRVRHVFEPDAGYTTLISVTGQQERSLLGLTSGVRGRPAGTPGVAIGIVTDARDPEKVGRVRVKLPWLRDDFETFWARVLQVGAGSGRGALVLPEVGDEVLVAFEQGDLDAPYVLGGLFSTKNPPARGQLADVGSGGKVERRAIVSRTGHALELLEGQQKKGVWLHTGDDKLKLAMDGTETVITVHSDGKVVVEAKQEITIDGQKIDLRAKSGITLDAGGGNVEVKGVNVELTGSAAAKLSAPNVSIDGKAKTELKGGAMAEIKAALVKIN
jgi:phage protein D/phage baseplate assembly protein gpV